MSIQAILKFVMGLIIVLFLSLAIICSVCKPNEREDGFNSVALLLKEGHALKKKPSLLPCVKKILLAFTGSSSRQLDAALFLDKSNK